MKAIELFDIQKKGILSQLQALDIFTLCLIAKQRNEEIPRNIIEEIIESPVLSSFSMFEMFYKSGEFDYLKQTEKIRHAGQQILLSTYVALENYLIEKFFEFLFYSVGDLPEELSLKLRNEISLRSIDEIKNKYKKFFEIHITCFDIEKYYSQEKCSFKFNDSWGAIKLLSKIRNDVAHKGKTEDYKIITLMDCWYPFEFVQNYVSLFDANFDILFYENRKTRLIKNYLIKVEKQEAEAKS